VIADDNDVVKVFIVEDHDVVVRGIHDIVADAADLTIVGSADEEASAIEMIRERVPDVVLLDLNLRYGMGVKVIEAIRPALSDVQFLALTASGNATDVIAVIRAGARGYLTKDVMGSALVEGIRTVHHGGAVVSPQLAAFALEAFGEDPPPAMNPATDLLTPREREVSTLVAKGYTNRQVAHDLGISAKTVEKHVSSVLDKLSLTNRSQVTRWVMENPHLNTS
jgi:DNA-binding NarL/FixJ family response regulator